VNDLAALGVVGVDSLARARGAALGSREALSAALCVHSSTASSRGGSRSGNSGHGSGFGSGDLFLGRCSGGAGVAGSSSTLPDSRSWHGESLAAVVDAEVGIGVGGLVCARELDEGTGGTTTAAYDLDLHAPDVVLWLVDVGAMNTNVLHAHQVLSVGSILGDLRSNEVPVVIAPGGRSEITSLADALLVDLEPITRSIVGLDTCRSLGHVNEARTRVAHLGTNGQLHADLVTGVDSQDLSLCGRREGTLVATNIGAISKRSIADVSRRGVRELDRVVLGRASRLADVFVSRLLDTANDVAVEEVVGSGHLGDSGDEKSRELHSDRAATNVLEK